MVCCARERSPANETKQNAAETAAAATAAATATATAAAAHNQQHLLDSREVQRLVHLTKVLNVCWGIVAGHVGSHHVVTLRTANQVDKVSADCLDALLQVHPVLDRLDVKQREGLVSLLLKEDDKSKDADVSERPMDQGVQSVAAPGAPAVSPLLNGGWGHAGGQDRQKLWRRTGDVLHREQA
eukprot:scaffold846_cov252-Pinguiococcus_pyrenoidosus.AAC.22